MSRAELAEAVYKIFKENNKTWKNDTELWETIAKAESEELMEFIYQHEKEHQNE